MKKGETAASGKAIENVRRDVVRIACFGGSNTFAYLLVRSYATVMRDILSRKSLVPIFVSISGETASLAQEAQGRFVNDVLSVAPHIVVLEFGGHERDFKRQPDAFRTVMNDLIAQVRQQGGRCVLIAPTLVQDKHHEDRSSPYARVLQSLAAETKSLYVDPLAQLTAAKKQGGRATLFRHAHDPTHWSVKGQEFVGKLVADAIIAAGSIPTKTA